MSMDEEQMRAAVAEHETKIKESIEALSGLLGGDHPICRNFIVIAEISESGGARGLEIHPSRNTTPWLFDGMMKHAADMSMEGGIVAQLEDFIEDLKAQRDEEDDEDERSN